MSGALFIRLSTGEAFAHMSHGSYRSSYSAPMPAAIPVNDASIRAALSTPRLSTYVRAAQGDASAGIALYGWNARISAALMVPAHFAEVTTRNAVSDALTAEYGAQWPWSAPFRRSLPTPGGPVFNPRKELVAVAGREPTTGKVIAELKFVFWEHMFTARHHNQIWQPQIAALFPHAAGQTPNELRGRIARDLNTIRKLRNRIAHHEPIIGRPLVSDLHQMLELIALRSDSTATWVRAMQDATQILADRP